MNTLASLVVVALGLYLLALAVVSLLLPARAARFLGGFAGSARRHFLELALRLVAGSALLLRAPEMLWSGFFTVFGWVLVVTTLGLLALPWRWHQWFAQRAVPRAIAHMRLVAAAAFLLGVLVLAAVFLGGGGERPGAAIASPAAAV